MTAGDPVSGPGPTVVLAGTAGGVGTTTLTALLADHLARTGGPPALLDHTGGGLAARLPDGFSTATDPELTLLDLGPHAWGPGTARLVDPGHTLVVVSAATPLGCALAVDCLTAVARAYGPAGLQRTCVALVGVFGRHHLRAGLADLEAAGAAAVSQLPQDLALAPGGPVPPARVSRRTEQAVAVLATAVRAGSDRPRATSRPPRAYRLPPT